MTSRRNSGQAGQAVKSAEVPAGDFDSALYSEILRGLPVGIVVLHLENPEDAGSFRIQDLNPAAAEAMGTTLDILRGRTLAEFPKLLSTAFPNWCQESFRTKEPCDLGEFSYGDESVRAGRYSARIFPLPGNFLGVCFENVSERKSPEQSEREDAEHFRLFLQGIKEYALFQLDLLGHVVNWNIGAERLKGYRAEEIIGKHFSVFYPREDALRGKPESILAEASSRGYSEDEGWRLRKDGTQFWANVIVTALRDSTGSVRGFIKLTRDMTERREREEKLTKANELLELRVRQRTEVLNRINQELRTEIVERQRAEEQLKSSLDQLRALAARIQSVREEERASVSREIHDELGQACTAIKMDLAMVGRKISKRQVRLRTKLNSANKLVDDMIFTLRRIASELRPRTLDDLGLTAALESQAQEFESRTGIHCHVILPSDPVVLDAERSTAIFRIFQESLTNVARHANARHVEARLEEEATQVLLWVRDDGNGFNPEEIKASKSLGLIGMQERALLLNGELKVQSAPGAGTTLVLRIPLPASSPA